jgi:hypothetical protein
VTNRAALDISVLVRILLRYVSLSHKSEQLNRFRSKVFSIRDNIFIAATLCVFFQSRNASGFEIYLF